MSRYKISKWPGNSTMTTPESYDELHISLEETAKYFEINAPITVRKKLIVNVDRTSIGGRGGDLILNPGCEVYWKGCRVQLRGGESHRYLLPLRNGVLGSRLQWVYTQIDKDGKFTDDFQVVNSPDTELKEIPCPPREGDFILDDRVEGSELVVNMLGCAIFDEANGFLTVSEKGEVHINCRDSLIIRGNIFKFESEVSLHLRAPCVITESLPPVFDQLFERAAETFKNHQTFHLKVLPGCVLDETATNLFSMVEMNSDDQLPRTCFKLDTANLAKVEECIICLEELRCNFTFCCHQPICIKCSQDWFSRSNSCPYCQGLVNTE